MPTTLSEGTMRALVKKLHEESMRNRQPISVLGMRVRPDIPSEMVKLTDHIHEKLPEYRHYGLGVEMAGFGSALHGLIRLATGEFPEYVKAEAFTTSAGVMQAMVMYGAYLASLLPQPPTKEMVKESLSKCVSLEEIMLARAREGTFL